MDVMTLAALLAPPRGGPVVLCHGCFDWLHIGHIRHFEAAKKLGLVLVVSVTPDKFVQKGPSRPLFSEDLRVDTVAALRCVDYAVINRWPTAVELIQLLRPDIYAKGNEYVDRFGAVDDECRAVEAMGGRVVFTDELTVHTSDLLTSLRSSV